MAFDGFLVPDWAKPYVGWALGSDWPEGDEDGLFRLADACAAMARRVVEDDEAARRGPPPPDEWDGEALEAFAAHVRTHVGGKRAQLVDRLVAAALEYNEMGVQVQYTKRMIEVSAWLLVLQLIWLMAAAAGPWGGLSFALVGSRVQIARLTIRQIAIRLLLNAAIFGGLMGGLDLGVQLSQGRRDEIDVRQALMSAGTGALAGVLLGGMSGGLSRLASSGLQAGLRRADMTLMEKVVAASGRSVWGMMGQAGLASSAATAATLAATGDFKLRTVLQAGTSGLLGGADAHAAGWTPAWRGATDPGRGTTSTRAGDTSPQSPHPDDASPRVMQASAPDASPRVMQASAPDGTSPQAPRTGDTSPRVAQASDPGGTSPRGTQAAHIRGPERLDPGGRLADSVQTGERSSRSVGEHEVVRFGDGVQAVKKSGEDGARLEAAALVRQAVGLDHPAIHRAGDIVYQRHGDERLHAATASGIRESHPQNLFSPAHEIVTFNDGTQAVRRAHPEAARADLEEQHRLPPYRAATEGHLRAGDLAEYQTRTTDDGGSVAKRDLVDLLTLGESFQPHEAHTRWRRGTTMNFDGENTLALADNWNFFVDRPPGGKPGVHFKHNQLSPQDLTVLRSRLDGLRPAFERLGRPDWHKGVMDRLRLLERHAHGDTRFLPDLDATPAPRIVPGAEPAALGPQRLGEPDPRPGETLRHLFDGEQLHRVNDAIAHDTPEAAQARALIDRASADLEELPSGLWGHVEARLPADWLPDGLTAGDRFSFPGVLEGVNNPRVLPDRPDTVHLVIRASDYVSTAEFLDRPHHASFRPGTEFKVLATLETNQRTTYFMLQEPAETVRAPAPAPRPELEPRLRHHFEEHRVPTEAGVWFRDPDDPHDIALSDFAQAVPRQEKLFVLTAHGSPEGMSIGGDRINGEELHALLHTDLSARPHDHVVYLVPCKIGQMDAGPPQTLANRTGRVVIAADSNMTVNTDGTSWPTTRSGLDALNARGRLRIFLPDEPMPPEAPLSPIERLLNHEDPGG
ncbi:hypothetical protein AB0I81_42065 [Nonomuraea sp. NPDC050404]|uniref:WXG100-like domain-containing protein n=1 Tax=Nonomuraea sp. NPDC050404 TaxID=3155783 RepID=UPI0033E54F3D